MNRLISLLLIFSLLLTFTACGGNDTDKKTTNTTSVSQTDANNKKPSQRPTSQAEIETTTNLPDTTVATGSIVTTTERPVDVPVTDNNEGYNDLEYEIITEPLAVFQRAVSKVVNDGAAEFSKKTWQDLYSSSVYSDNNNTNSVIGSVESTILDLMSGFFTAEEDALSASYSKGSSHIKDRMPLSNCSPEYMSSVACVKEGAGYRITIIMNPQTNPSRSDTDGLNVMSKDLIYMEDVKNEFMNVAASSPYIREFKDGSVTYNAYVIEAIMSWDHKLISITHYCDVDMYVAVNAMYAGNLYMNWSFSTHTVYQGFIY